MSEETRSSRSETAEKIDLLPLLSTIWKLAKKTWWLCLVLMVLFGGFRYVKTVRSYTPSYTATASFLVSTNNDFGSLSAGRYYNRITAKQLSTTFPFILTSGALNKIVANDLGLSYVPGSISASMVGETNLFQIHVTAADPQAAYDILCSVVKNYPQVARYIIGDTQLKLLEESGVPSIPSNSLNPTPGAVKSALLGAVIYACILALLALSRRTIRTKNDLKSYLNVKYLGSIPQVHFKRRSTKRQNNILLDNPNLPGDYSSAIETLQLRLVRTLQQSGYKTLLVTSSLMGEGKTTTTCNLAMLLAEKGGKVLLIDGDLRQPSVTKCLRQSAMERSPGLRQYLAGADNVSDMICQYKQTSLYVLPAGAAVNEVSQLYTNGRMEKLLRTYREEMDYIIIDTPPCTFMHDTSLLAPCFDAGLIVIRQDYAPTSKVMSCAEILAQAGLPLAGCVINGDTIAHSSYGYGKYSSKYGYGKYGYGSYRK